MRLLWPTAYPTLAIPSWLQAETRSCSQAVSKPVWHIPMLCVQWKTLDDGQRNCPKHEEFHSKNKLEKLVHPVGYHSARSHERQKSSRYVTAKKCNILITVQKSSVHMKCPSHSSQLLYTNNSYWVVQTMKLLIMKFSSVSCYFLPVTPKHFLLCPILEYPQYMRSPLFWNVGNQWPAFWDNVLVSSSRVKMSGHPWPLFFH